jgi:hypothetical protein
LVSLPKLLNSTGAVEQNTFTNLPSEGNNYIQGKTEGREDEEKGVGSYSITLSE